MIQAERALQQEIMIRLHRAPLNALVLPIPNSVYMPTRSEREKELVKRIVHQLKVMGGLSPGAPDLVFLGPRGCGAIELKRPPMKTLFGKHARGQLSKTQRETRDRFRAMGVPFAVCESWGEVRDTLIDWDMLPADYARSVA